MRILLTLFFLLLLSQNALFSQNLSSVELLRKLKNSKDTDRVNVLNRLSKIYYTSELDKAENYASSALSLGKELNYHKGISLSYLVLAQASGQVELF